MSGGRAGGADPRRGWTGEELAASGEHRQHLSAERVRRLARELPTDLGAADLETVGAVRAALVEPLGDVADELRDRLGPEGLGIAVVTGDGLDALGDARSATLLWGLTVLLGRPMVQNAEDELLVSVRDARPSDVHTARGYLSNGGMLMHTDPSDVAALLCIEASADGGTSLFSSAPAVRAVLRREAPHLWDEYHRIWTWDLRGMQEPSTDPYVTTPIFCDHEGRLACRYGALMLREGRGLDGPPPARGRRGARSLRGGGEAAHAHPSPPPAARRERFGSTIIAPFTVERASSIGTRPGRFATCCAPGSGSSQHRTSLPSFYPSQGRWTGGTGVGWVIPDSWT
jgi:hypothetical protein